MSTRRFCARPSAVLLSATGSLYAFPAVVIRLLGIPFWFKNVATACARCVDTLSFTANVPVLSVCPQIVISVSGLLISDVANSLRAALDEELRVVPFVGNNMPLAKVTFTAFRPFV